MRHKWIVKSGTATNEYVVTHSECRRCKSNRWVYQYDTGKVSRMYSPPGIIDNIKKIPECQYPPLSVEQAIDIRRQRQNSNENKPE